MTIMPMSRALMPINDFRRKPFTLDSSLRPIRLRACLSLQQRKEPRYNTATRVLIQNGAHDGEVPQDTIVDFVDDPGPLVCRNVRAEAVLPAGVKTVTCMSRA